MKNLNLFSPNYKNKKINFGGFILNFDAEGKAIVNLESDEKEAEFRNKVLSVYPNLVSDKKDILNTTNIKKGNVSVEEKNSSEYKILKDSNIKLAKENASLKKEKEELIKENTLLKKEKEELEKQLLSIKKEDSINIDAELNSKSVDELKSILGEIYVDFKEEWKNLTKKEDIIQYIKSKNAK